MVQDKATKLNLKEEIATTIGENMQGYNCIMVFDESKNKLLFCKRQKPPYEGLYNLVGGKVEPGEDGFGAAYRELEEETGITKKDITLAHMMDFTYYNQSCYVEVYVGYLMHSVILREEAHTLCWLDMNHNFFDDTKFAGEGNIGHMVEQVKIYGQGVMQNEKTSFINLNYKCIGIDGCKGGWIAAILDEGKLTIEKHATFKEIIKYHPIFDAFLVDMIIGLQSSNKQLRPDSFARKLIPERASTIFPAPSRQAVYAYPSSIAKAYEENVKALGKKFTPLTVGIIPKILEVDQFLQENEHYKNVIREGHPELCFSKLKGSTVLSKKTEIEGISERIKLLAEFINEISLEDLHATAKKLKCRIDDILDAICLAITANMIAQKQYEVIPSAPMKDDTGLYMQLLVPNFNKS